MDYINHPGIKHSAMKNKTTIIFGPPGCGKTYKLLEILEDLIRKGTSPKDIAFVSFTNKGVDAGVERARKMFNIHPNATPFWRTLHSIANRVSCRNVGTIIQKRHYKEFGNRLGLKLNGYYDEELKKGVDDVYLFLEQVKRQNPHKYVSLAYNLISQGADLGKLEWIIENYRGYKKSRRVYDFTDMLEYFVNDAENDTLPVEYALVDEAQDLTPLQWRMVEKAFADCKHIFIAGDDDQAIYDWCGGSVGSFLSYRTPDTPDTPHSDTPDSNNNESNRYSNVEILSQSYRLNSQILNISQKVIEEISKAQSGNGAQRQEKIVLPIKTIPNTDKRVFVHQDLSSVPLDYNKSYYFLSRNNIFLTRYMDVLMQNNLPFILNRGNGIKYPRQIVTARDKASFLRKENDLERTYIENMRRMGYKYAKDYGSFIVSTIHKVKGGEADVVVILLDMTKAVYENYMLYRAEELRTLYVGLTRAKESLHIVLSSGASDFVYDANFCIGV